MTLDLQSETIQTWLIIRVKGQVDSKTVNQLRDFLEAQVKGDSPIALDLTDVPFMSSAGLRTLLTLHRQTQSLGVELALLGLIETIADTMKVTGFYDFFNIYDTFHDLPSR